MILNNKGTEDEAKDIFQEAMIVLYDKITQAEGFELSSKLNTFLYSICRRLWLKQLNRRNLSLDSIDQENLDIPDMDSALESHEAEEVKFNQMEAAMANLGEPCASILKEFYIKKKSMQEICDQLGYTNADNAKNQKYKCLQRLKKLFFDQWVKDER
ncbi:RNA polymerase sigma factor [Sphingobacterium sp. 1.A.4]|uniref:RNA polymerase sigma factor n=1 Tax=Sphingobacterium sp. 1.A.4 TaxID=2044603 RepID=UPI00359C68A1